MRHGYTNSTELVDGVVIKSYRGPLREVRLRREQAALRGLAEVFPVPPLLVGDDVTRTANVAGVHGQDLIAAGRADAVLAACGTALRTLQALAVDTVFPGATGTLVHGDFGPNNALFTPDGEQVVTVLDWEHCHPGDPLEDLVWCEWIVRMHHPEEVDALPSLFAAYGDQPSWSQRHAEMLRHCSVLEGFCGEWDDDGAGVRRWRERTAQTAAWSERL